MSRTAGKDLGTYHVRVTFEDGRAFIMDWKTSARFSHGRGDFSPVRAGFIPPTWENETELLSGIIYMFTQGNYSCDCNLETFFANSIQEEPPDVSCGNTCKIRKLDILRPNAGKEFQSLWIRALEH